MSVEIAWKQNILVTDFYLLKSLLVVLGFGSQAFICGFSRQNICSAPLGLLLRYKKYSKLLITNLFNHILNKTKIRRFRITPNNNYTTFHVTFFIHSFVESCFSFFEHAKTPWVKGKKFKNMLHSLRHDDPPKSLVAYI